jgi:hypothetical protein
MYYVNNENEWRVLVGKLDGIDQMDDILKWLFKKQE